MRLAIPESAVLQDTDGRFVFVVDDNSVAHKRKVEVENGTNNNWIINSGLQKSEKIVSVGVSKVMDNVPVEIIQDEDNIDKKSEEK